jgi:glutamine cyclotransferase
MRQHLAVFILLLFIVVASTGFQAKRAPAPVAPKKYGYRVVNTYPHDSTAFTQGLEFREGALYEGTGQTGRSSVRKVDLQTGKVIQQIPLQPKYFGEGITVLNRQIVQLTWITHIGFIYDQSTFRVMRDFNYTGEGWGLANDGTQIYMSDGTPDIRILDPTTLEENRRITVRDGAVPVKMLNELEYVRGELYSNVWQTDRIARISLKDGSVAGWIDMTGILSPEERMKAGPDGVLNGIAFDQLGNRLFVTGKLWPKLFEIQVIEKK